MPLVEKITDEIVLKAKRFPHLSDFFKKLCRKE